MFRKFMAGRYGFDYYTLILLLFSLMFLQTGYLWVLSPVLMGYALFRILSRNRESRLRELNGFMKVMNRYLGFIYGLFRRIGHFFGLQRMRYRERKTSVFVHCRKCKKVLRLPKNKGRLEVLCPVCGSHFIHKT